MPPESDFAAAGDGIDWRLGAEDRTHLFLRWWAVLTLGAIAGLFVIAAVALMVEAVTTGRGGRAAAATFVGSFALGAATACWAVFSRFAWGGWWGRAVEDLSYDMASASGTLRAALAVFSGLRVTHFRDCIVLAAPYRLVLVSRGWNAWVVGGVLVWTAVVLASCIGGDPVWIVLTVISGLTSSALCVAFAGRRAEVHEIPWGDLEAVLPVRDGGFRVGVPGGPLAPAFTFTPWFDQYSRFLSGVLQYRPDLVPEGELERNVPTDAPPPPQAVPPDGEVEERLSRVQKRFQDED